MKRMMFLILFLLAISYCGSVLALGVSPSRVTLKFVPDYVYEGNICFSIGSIPTLKIEAAGEFKDNLEFINLDENNILDASKDECLHYKFKMPASIPISGTHRTIIYATETPEATEQNIYGLVRIEHQIDIVVSYPEKYLEISDFSAQNVDAGNPVPFTLSFANKGNETVDQVRATILIYDNNNTQIGILDAGVANNINPDQVRNFNINWNSGSYNEGNYHAVVDIGYDNNAWTNASINFKLGGLDVNIVDYSKEIIIGGIKDFYVTVDSIWSDTVHNVKTIVDVYNLSNSPEPITSFETLARDLAPWGTENLKGYLDTTNLNLGTYDLKMTLYYEDLSKIYNKTLDIKKEPSKPEIRPEKVTPHEIVAPPTPQPEVNEEHNNETTVNETSITQPTLNLCSDGKREIENDKSAYCNEGTWKEQKQDNQSCQNNYECLSNFCSKGTCYDIVSQLKENTNLIQRIFNWFKHLFTGK